MPNFIARLSLIAAITFSFSVQADTAADYYVKLSFLSPKAFECSVLASNETEQARLFAVGLDSGRKFIQFRKNNPEGFTAIESSIPMLWIASTRLSGVSDDLVLGQVYTMMVVALVSGTSDQDLDNSLKKGELFSGKGCDLI